MDKSPTDQFCRGFLAVLREREELLTEFDNRLWLALADYAEVHGNGMVTFHFFDGTQITE